MKGKAEPPAVEYLPDSIFGIGSGYIRRKRSPIDVSLPRSIPLLQVQKALLNFYESTLGK